MLVGGKKLVSLIFTFFKRQKLNNFCLESPILLKVMQTGLYLVTFKFTVIDVLNFQ